MILFLIITIIVFLLLYLIQYEKEASLFSDIWLGVKSIFFSILISILVWGIFSKIVESISDKALPIYEEKYILQPYNVDNKEYYSIPAHHEDYGDMNFQVIKIDNKFKKLDVKYDDNCPRENIVYTKTTHLEHQWIEKAIGIRYVDEELVYKVSNNKILNVEVEK